MVKCVRCHCKFQPYVVLQGQRLIRQLDNGEWWCWSCRREALPLGQLDLFDILGYGAQEE